MKVGRFRETILIEAATPGAADGYGAPAVTWAPRCTLRAELVTAEREGAPAGSAGKRDKRTVTFRTRTFGGVMTRDRVTWKGDLYTVTAVKAADFAAAAGMELICEALT